MTRYRTVYACPACKGVVADRYSAAYLTDHCPHCAAAAPYRAMVGNEWPGFAARRVWTWRWPFRRWDVKWPSIGPPPPQHVNCRCVMDGSITTVDLSTDDAIFIQEPPHADRT